MRTPSPAKTYASRATAISGARWALSTPSLLKPMVGVHFDVLPLEDGGFAWTRIDLTSAAKEQV